MEQQPEFSFVDDLIKKPVEPSVEESEMKPEIPHEHKEELPLSITHCQYCEDADPGCRYCHGRYYSEK